MAIERQWLSSLPLPNGALEAVQRRGRELLRSSSMPQNSQEEWRVTDINQLNNLLALPLSYAINKPLNTNTNRWPNEPVNGLRIVLDPHESSINNLGLPKGISMLSALELEQNLGHTLEQCSCKGDWPVAINHASANQVLALKIQGRDLPPIELVIKSTPDSFNPTRVLLILEEKARIDLLQVILGENNSAESHIVEIHLGQEAEINHGFLALGDNQSRLLSHLAIEQEPRSHYSFTSIQHGWSLGRIEPHIVQVHGQAKTTLKGLQVSSDKQQLATHSYVRFNGPDGQLDQLQKAAAEGESHCIFNGAVDVPRIAQKTNAAQLSRNLLLSKRARIDTKPELKIIADDVTCTHGATVTQLQAEELFYLRSRGIGPNQATSLLFRGYCQDIIETLPVEANRWDCLNNLMSTLPNDV